MTKRRGSALSRYWTHSLTHTLTHTYLTDPTTPKAQIQVPAGKLAIAALQARFRNKQVLYSTVTPYRPVQYT